MSLMPVNPAAASKEHELWVLKTELERVSTDLLRTSEAADADKEGYEDAVEKLMQQLNEAEAERSAVIEENEGLSAHLHRIEIGDDSARIATGWCPSCQLDPDKRDMLEEAAQRSLARQAQEAESTAKEDKLEMQREHQRALKQAVKEASNGHQVAIAEVQGALLRAQRQLQRQRTSAGASGKAERDVRAALAKEKRGSARLTDLLDAAKAELRSHGSAIEFAHMRKELQTLKADRSSIVKSARVQVQDAEKQAEEMHAQAEAAGRRLTKEQEGKQAALQALQAAKASHARARAADKKAAGALQARLEARLQAIQADCEAMSMQVAQGEQAMMTAQAAQGEQGGLCTQLQQDLDAALSSSEKLQQELEAANQQLQAVRAEAEGARVGAAEALAATRAQFDAQVEAATATHGVRHAHHQEELEAAQAACSQLQAQTASQRASWEAQLLAAAELEATLRLQHTQQLTALESQIKSQSDEEVVLLRSQQASQHAEIVEAMTAQHDELFAAAEAQHSAAQAQQQAQHDADRTGLQRQVEDAAAEVEAAQEALGASHAQFAAAEAAAEAAGAAYELQLASAAEAHAGTRVEHSKAVAAFEREMEANARDFEAQLQSAQQAQEEASVEAESSLRHQHQAELAAAQAEVEALRATQQQQLGQVVQGASEKLSKIKTAAEAQVMEMAVELARCQEQVQQQQATALQQRQEAAGKVATLRTKLDRQEVEALQRLDELTKARAEHAEEMVRVLQQAEEAAAAAGQASAEEAAKQVQEVASVRAKAEERVRALTESFETQMATAAQLEGEERRAQQQRVAATEAGLATLQQQHAEAMAKTQTKAAAALREVQGRLSALQLRAEAEAVASKPMKIDLDTATKELKLARSQLEASGTRHTVETSRLKHKLAVDAKKEAAADRKAAVAKAEQDTTVRVTRELTSQFEMASKRGNKQYDDKIRRLERELERALERAHAAKAAATAAARAPLQAVPHGQVQPALEPEQLDDMVTRVNGEGGGALELQKTEKEGVYTYGERKLHLCVLNGVINVRVGGGFMSFNDFKQRHGRKEAARVKGKSSKGTHPEEASNAPLKSSSSRRQSLGTRKTPAKTKTGLPAGFHTMKENRPSLA